MKQFVDFYKQMYSDNPTKDQEKLRKLNDEIRAGKLTETEILKKLETFKSFDEEVEEIEGFYYSLYESKFLIFCRFRQGGVHSKKSAKPEKTKEDSKGTKRSE